MQLKNNIRSDYLGAVQNAITPKVPWHSSAPGITSVLVLTRAPRRCHQMRTTLIDWLVDVSLTLQVNSITLYQCVRASVPR